MSLPQKIELPVEKESPSSPKEKVETVSSPKKKFSFKFKLPFKLPTLSRPVKTGLFIFLGLILFLVLASGIFALSARKPALSASQSLKQIKIAFQEKDLVAVN